MADFDYQNTDLTPAEVEGLPGPTLLEFGANWCGICRGTRPIVQAALADLPQVRHLRVADRSGARLGRRFGVKLWPTLVFLLDGREITRLVRPYDQSSIDAALAAISGAAAATPSAAPPVADAPDRH